MNKPKHYNLPEVFNNTNLGFVFEFYSSKDVNFIVEQLSNLTIKNVVLTNSYEYEPSYSHAVLVKEYEGKKPRYSFKMGQQRYDSIIPLMKNVTEWISETSDCTNDTILRVNMSFDHSHLKTLNTISKMNPQKLILKLDEEFIYDRFPEQEDSPYSLSIKQLLPISETVYGQDLVKNVNYIIGVPNKSYYGVNFENYSRGILQFNYTGGLNYSGKIKELLEVIQYYIIKTFQSLNEVDFNKEEIKELKYLTNEFYRIQEAYYDPESFTKLFPEIKIAVDLRRDSQLLKSFWPKIRPTLFEMVINNNFREGQFNLDTQFGIFQLRNADLNCTSIKGYDLVNCNINGVLENCNIVQCKVNNARLYNCKIVHNTKVYDSYIFKSYADAKNLLEGCFIENDYELLNCNIKNSIVKFAGLGKEARIDEQTVIIDKETKLQQPKVGVEIEEMRDYKWIKNLSGKKQDGHIFGNEYIKKTKYL